MHGRSSSFCLLRTLRSLEVCEVQTLHEGRKMQRNLHTQSHLTLATCTCTEMFHKVSQRMEVNNHIPLGL